MKPISIIESSWYFIISFIVIYSGLYYGIPVLQSKGMEFLYAYFIVFHIPLFLLIVVALVLYHFEGNCWSWDNFRKRIWLNKMERVDWLWMMGLFVAGILFYFMLAPIGDTLANINFFKPPDFFPAEINPLKNLRKGYVMDYKLSGQYMIAVIYFISWATNILGEEILFRGMILRRQMIKYEKLSWVYHAIIWTLWHAFWKWNLISIFPFALALSYTVYKRKNITISIISHGLMNAIPLILIIYEIFK